MLAMLTAEMESGFYHRILRSRHFDGVIMFSSDIDDPILPLVGTAPADVNNTMMSYDHSSEVATAGYFSAKSSSDTIQTEITTTQHAGIARITYPASTQAALLIKLRDSQNQRTKDPLDPSSAQIVGGNEIIGNTTSGHFCGAGDTYVVHFDLVFDHPFTAQVLGTGAAGPDGIFVSFNTTANRVVMAKLGMSFVSNANAKANWQAEIPAFDFNAVRTATHAKWNSLLGKIEVAGGTADQRTVFYSDLYHVLNHPNVVSDVNGQYLGYDKMGAHRREWTDGALRELLRLGHLPQRGVPGRPGRSRGDR